MYEAIDNLGMEISTNFHNLNGEDKFLTLMGMIIDGTNPDDMLKVWNISWTCISMIYRTTVFNHAELCNLTRYSFATQTSPQA